MRERLSDRGRGRLRTIITIIATAAIIAPAAALATNSFSDVSDSDFFHDAVDWMASNGVTVGCNPPNNTQYCPDDFVTRGQMAVFLERLDTQDVFLRPGDVSMTDGGGDADTLDGKDSTAFLLKTQKAADSDLLDGKDSTAFLLDTEKAADSDKLDGKDSTAFLGVTEKAADSELLDGKDSTAFGGRLFAVVALDGTLSRGNGATSAGRLFVGAPAGTYQVIFNRDVTGCAYVATIGSTGGGVPAHGSIAVASLDANANGVWINTKDLNGTDTDRPFHLFVIC